MISPRLIVMLGALLLFASGLAYIGHLRAANANLRLAIAQGALDAERATREAVEQARLYERSQRDAMAAAAQDAVAKARADEAATLKRFTALQRAIQEAADADPSVDAWRNTPIPDAIRLLIEPRDPDPDGRGDSISIPPNPR